MIIEQKIFFVGICIGFILSTQIDTIIFEYQKRKMYKFLAENKLLNKYYNMRYRK